MIIVIRNIDEINLSTILSKKDNAAYSTFITRKWEVRKIRSSDACFAASFRGFSG